MFLDNILIWDKSNRTFAIAHFEAEMEVSCPSKLCNNVMCNARRYISLDSPFSDQLVVDFIIHEYVLAQANFKAKPMQVRPHRPTVGLSHKCCFCHCKTGLIPLLPPRHSDIFHTLGPCERYASLMGL